MSLDDFKDFKSKDVKPMESIYFQALNQKQNENYNSDNYNTNEKADFKISELLKK